MYAKQSTAKTFILGPTLDADGVADTGVVVGAIKVSKNGTVGAPHGSSTLTHDHTGNYKYAANAGDFDTRGEVTFSLNDGTTAMAPRTFQVVPANVYDSLVSGSDLLDINAKEISDETTAADAVQSVFLGTGVADDIDLEARSLVITNDAGVGVAVTGTTAGVKIDGNDALFLTGLSGSGLFVTGSSGQHAASFIGVGSGAGFNIAGGTTGNGILATGGATSGSAMKIVANGTNDIGLEIIGIGSGAGMKSTGGATGDGLYAQGGASGGAGIKGEAQANNDAGMELILHGTGSALSGALVAGNFAASSLDGKGDWNTVVPDAAGVAPTAAEVVNEWESQSQADPTGFHVNVIEWRSEAVPVTADTGIPQVNTQYWFGTEIAGVNTVGVPSVDVIQLGGVTQSLTDLKDFADAGYNPGTNKVEGVTGGATEAKQDTAQTDLDTITGADGVFLAVASQPAGWPANLAASAGTVVKATVDTVTNTHTPTTTEFQADDITEATADHFNGRIVIFTSGALINQATDITDYEAVGGIGQITCTALTEAPANNDTFVIV